MVEKKNKMSCSYVVVRDTDGNAVIVNITFLKEHPFILGDGAQIFRWISGLEPHPSHLLRENTRSTEEQLQDLFVNYHIKRMEWTKFTGFLTLPEHYADSKYDMGIIINLCLKIGIDIRDITMHKSPNNPMSPAEDVMQEFKWNVINVNQVHDCDGDEKWSIASKIELPYFYVRKKKLL